VYLPFFLLVQLGRRDVERERDLLARRVARRLDRLEITSSASSSFFEVGAKPPSSPTPVRASA
jgi:hypothetical protein